MVLLRNTSITREEWAQKQLLICEELNSVNLLLDKQKQKNYLNQFFREKTIRVSLDIYMIKLLLSNNTCETKFSAFIFLKFTSNN